MRPSIRVPTSQEEWNLLSPLPTDLVHRGKYLGEVRCWYLGVWVSLECLVGGALLLGPYILCLCVSAIYKTTDRGEESWTWLA